LLNDGCHDLLALDQRQQNPAAQLGLDELRASCQLVLPDAFFASSADQFHNSLVEPLDFIVRKMTSGLDQEGRDAVIDNLTRPLRIDRTDDGLGGRPNISPRFGIF
jgi:hypothetical protein